MLELTFLGVVVIHVKSFTSGHYGHFQVIEIGFQKYVWTSQVYFIPLAKSYLNWDLKMNIKINYNWNILIKLHI